MGKIKSVFSNIGTWVKSHVKVVVAVVVVVVFAIVALNFIGGAEKRAVKKYIAAVNSCDSSKVMKAVDAKAAVAWSNAGYSDEDIIKNFKDEFDDVTDDDVDDFKDDVKDRYHKENKGKVKYQLKDVVYASKAKDNKNLTKVVCRVEVTSKPSEDAKDDLEDSVWKDEKAYTTKAETYMTFYLYKNKVVASPMESVYSLLN